MCPEPYGAPLGLFPLSMSIQLGEALTAIDL